MVKGYSPVGSGSAFQIVSPRQRHSSTSVLMIGIQCEELLKGDGTGSRDRDGQGYFAHGSGFVVSP